MSKMCTHGLEVLKPCVFYPVNPPLTPFLTVLRKVKKPWSRVRFRVKHEGFLDFLDPRVGFVISDTRMCIQGVRWVPKCQKR